MASLLIRTTTYRIEGQDRTVKLKKWSTDKFLTLVGVIGEVISGVESKVKFNEELDVRKIGLLLVSLVGTAKDALVRIVVETIDEDPPVTAQEVLSWDPEDFVGALEACLKLNLTEALGKKVMGLRGLTSRQQS